MTIDVDHQAPTLTVPANAVTGAGTGAPGTPVDAQTGARLADLASRTNLGALDTLLAVAKHAGASPGRNTEAAATARRLGRRMTTSMAQFRIATAPR